MSIFFSYVLDDSSTSLIREIDVYIGHGDTGRIQKSLEEKLIAKRVYISDA
jgi:hypothetical protein